MFQQEDYRQLQLWHLYNQLHWQVRSAHLLYYWLKCGNQGGSLIAVWLQYTGLDHFAA